MTRNDLTNRLISLLREHSSPHEMKCYLQMGVSVLFLVLSDQGPEGVPMTVVRWSCAALFLLGMAKLVRVNDMVWSLREAWFARSKSRQRSP